MGSTVPENELSSSGSRTRQIESPVAGGGEGVVVGGVLGGTQGIGGAIQVQHDSGSCSADAQSVVRIIPEEVGVVLLEDASCSGKENRTKSRSEECGCSCPSRNEGLA